MIPLDLIGRDKTCHHVWRDALRSVFIVSTYYDTIGLFVLALRADTILPTRSKKMLVMGKPQ